MRLLNKLKSQYSHSVLLLVLIVVAFIRPIFGLRQGMLGFTDIILFVLLLIGAMTAQSSRISLRPVLIGAGLTVVSYFIQSTNETDAAILGFIGCCITFLILVAIRVLTALVEPNSKVTADVLCGAVSVYLTIGIIFALAFVAVEILHPGSFVFSTGTPEAESFFWRFLGFSFITLTTLGYGNVSPSSEQGDALAGLEAVIGQFYVAVVIARLVALYTVDTAPSDSDETEAATGVEK